MAQKRLHRALGEQFSEREESTPSCSYFADAAAPVAHLVGRISPKTSRYVSPKIQPTPVSRSPKISSPKSSDYGAMTALFVCVLAALSATASAIPLAAAKHQAGKLNFFYKRTDKMYVPLKVDLLLRAGWRLAQSEQLGSTRVRSTRLDKLRSPELARSEPYG